jgi:hypothetical protein
METLPPLSADPLSRKIGAYDFDPELIDAVVFP